MWHVVSWLIRVYSAFLRQCGMAPKETANPDRLCVDEDYTQGHADGYIDGARWVLLPAVLAGMTLMSLSLTALVFVGHFTRKFLGG